MLAEVADLRNPQRLEKPKLNIFDNNPEAFNCRVSLLLEGFVTPMSDTQHEKSGLQTRSMPYGECLNGIHTRGTPTGVHTVDFLIWRMLR